jgi:hypothetical protein
LPAEETQGGAKKWFENGLVTRELVVTPDGCDEWYKVTPGGDRILHRDDGPAIIHVENKYQKWYTDGVLTREFVVDEQGTKSWFLVNDDGTKVLHRGDNLPAVERKDGTEEWYLHGVMVKTLGFTVKSAGCRVWHRASLDCEGSQMYFHSEDGLPSVEWSDGSLAQWHERGVLVKARTRTLDGCVKWFRAVDGTGTLVLHGGEEDQPAVTLPDGTRKWYVNGKPHRDGDKPNVVLADGTQKWTDEDERLHREGSRPALIRPNGDCKWYVRGVLGRDGDEPTVVLADGTQMWKDFLGDLHREGNKPALVKLTTTTKTYRWYLEGELQKGMTVAADGTQTWTDKNGKLHGVYGEPAVIHGNGDKFWFRHGICWRADGKPTCELVGGTKKWLKGDGQTVDRGEDKPAVVYTNGRKCWYRNGKKWRRFYQPRTLPESERDKDKEYVWRPRVITAVATGHCCPQCSKPYTEFTGPVVVCAAAGHAMCTACLQGFMDKLNMPHADDEEDPHPCCPKCSGKLLSTIVVPPPRPHV